MDQEIKKLEALRDLMLNSGRELILGLLILIVGLLVTKWVGGISIQVFILQTHEIVFFSELLQ